MATADSKQNQFITLEKSDPQFKIYLEGRLADMVSLPVQSLNVGLASERVTFQLFPRDQFQSKDEPSFLLKWFLIFKAHLWLFIFFPVFLVFSKNFSDFKSVDYSSFALTSLAAFFVALGLLLKSDYSDYYRGADRLDMSTLKPLTQGWVSAFAVKTWSWIYFVLGLLLALPVSFKYTQMFRVTVVVVFTALITRLFKDNNFKFKKYYEVFFFILVGPALFSGLQVGMGFGIDTEILVLGGVWGLLGVFYLEIKNFENLIILAQMNVQSSMTVLGFDRGKIFLMRLWIFIVLALAIYRFYYASFFWFWFGLLLNLFFSFKVLSKINSVTSPAGSELKDFSSHVRRWIGVFLLIWLIENLFYIFS